MKGIVSYTVCLVIYYYRCIVIVNYKQYCIPNKLVRSIYNTVT